MRAPLITRRRLIPRAYEELGYSTQEYDDHVITLSYKGVEIAAFSPCEDLADQVNEVLARHFIKTATASASLLAGAL